MKRFFAFALCIFMTVFVLSTSSYAIDLFHNTINEQEYIFDAESITQYTVGYTVACNCTADWNLTKVEDPEEGTYYTGTVPAGATISAQINCPLAGENVALGIIMVAGDADGNEVARVEMGNGEDNSEMVTAEMLIPDDASMIQMMVLAIPRKLGQGESTSAGVMLLLTVDGKEDFSSVANKEETEDFGKETVVEEKNGSNDDYTDDSFSVADSSDEDGKISGKAVAGGVATVGIAAVLIGIIKSSAAKSAASAGAKAVSESTVKATTTSAGKSVTNGSGSKKSIASDDSYVVTDPATGAQTLYVKDEAGNWVSSDGNSVLDTGSLDSWKSGRENDRAWQDKANEDIKKPTRFEDIDRKEELENEKIHRESYIEKVAVSHGVDAANIDDVYEKVAHDQAKAEVDAQDWSDIADDIDKVIDVTEDIKTVSDYSISALGAVSGPVGTAVKDIYTAGTTIAGDVSEAVAAGKDAYDVAQTAAASVAKASIGVIQNHASGVGGKALADIAGGAVTGGLDAYVGGESVAEGIATGAASGTLSAMVDAGGEMAGALTDGSNLSSLGKDLAKASTDVAGDFVKNAASDAVDESFSKTFEELGRKKK